MFESIRWMLNDPIVLMNRFDPDNESQCESDYVTESQKKSVKYRQSKKCGYRRTYSESGRGSHFVFH